MPINDPTDVFKYYEMKGPDECWPYIGKAWGGRSYDKRPYFMCEGRRQIAYRWIYELVHGITLESYQLILHSCDSGGYPIGCGNVHHMRIGTNKDNADDRTDRQRFGMPHHVVRAIRTLLKEGKSQQEIANTYGVSRENISAIATQRTYKHVLD